MTLLSQQTFALHQPEQVSRARQKRDLKRLLDSVMDWAVTRPYADLVDYVVGAYTAGLWNVYESPAALDSGDSQEVSGILWTAGLVYGSLETARADSWAAALELSGEGNVPPALIYRNISRITGGRRKKMTLIESLRAEQYSPGPKLPLTLSAKVNTLLPPAT